MPSHGSCSTVDYTLQMKTSINEVSYVVNSTYAATYFLEKTYEQHTQLNSTVVNIATSRLFYKMHTTGHLNYWKSILGVILEVV